MAAIPYDVAAAFMRHRPAKRGNFVSHGDTIYSYNVQLAAWISDGPHWVVDPVSVRDVSMTTARHVNALLYYLPYRR